MPSQPSIFAGNTISIASPSPRPDPSAAAAAAPTPTTTTTTTTTTTSTTSATPANPLPHRSRSPAPSSSSTNAFRSPPAAGTAAAAAASPLLLRRSPIAGVPAPARDSHPASLRPGPLRLPGRPSAQTARDPAPTAWRRHGGADPSRDPSSVEIESQLVSQHARKRCISDDPSHPTAGPSSKRIKRGPRHHEHRINLTNLSPRGPSKSAAEPPSPLFFSNTPHQRPPLPPRFSSSEAGARMMKKASAEDGTSVRTVRMARGSVHLANSPPRAAIHSPAVRASLERSVSRSMTPDEREAASNGLQALAEIGIYELLDQDDRVAFVVDIGSRHIYHPGPLGIIFANRALRTYSSLLDLVCGRFKDDQSVLLGETATFPEFKSWVTSFVKDYEAMDVVLPSFTFAGVTWNVSTLRKRFRVISGAVSPETTRMGSNPASALPATSVGTSTIAARPSKSAGGRMEEPKDYFGQIDVVFKSPTPPHPTPNKTVLSSIETPQSTSRRITSPSDASTSSVLPDAPTVPGSGASPSPLSILPNQTALSIATTAFDENKPMTPGSEQGFFDWTRLPITPALPKHIRFARSIDWASTALGPIETWPLVLRTMCNLIMASPHPAAMYWGPELIAIYNEPYILLAGQKHPRLMGLPYSVAWKEIWEDVKDSFATAQSTGQSTMKDDDRLFMNRSGYLEETYFSWSIIPLVGDDGTVVGLYNPAFEKTRRKIAERRMLTLREVGERTASAREVRSFWGQVLKGLEDNEYDTPFVLLYSVSEDTDSDESSIHSNSVQSVRQCVLAGTLPELPVGHPAAPQTIDLRSGEDGFGPVFREAMTMDKPVLIEVENGTLNPDLIDGIDFRGFKERPRAAVVCPIHPTTGESTIGFLVMGINPRRPYDDDYNLFIQLLGRQLATSMASVVLFEEEIRRGQRAAKLAALDRIELSEQLAARTQEAEESETKFTRMAAFAPVGMFIANKEGRMTFTNEAFHKIAMLPEGSDIDDWMESVRDEDRDMLHQTWDDLIVKCTPMSVEFRFKSPWEDRNGIKQDNWVLGSAYPEQNEYGQLKTVFGTITNISQQKWAEDYQRRRMEEAVELKRQQTNFMDMTSHEMRNPLSAILQCADEIADSLSDFKAGTTDYKIPAALLESNIDAAQTIALCANHQTRIVSDVLTLSKLDSALLLVTPVDVRPATIVQQALKMFDGELQTADIRMSFVIDKSLDNLDVKWVRLDPSRLLQVLINLTTNAIKFTTTQARRTITVTMSATRDPPTRNKEADVEYIHSRSRKKDVVNGKDWGDGELIFLHFSVRDTGKGLTESEKKLLFLRFSQASPKTHVQYGGSGLGLFISRELVELQGGEIGVISESGKGSTFAFYVKARRSTAPKNEHDEFRALSSAGNRKSSLPKLSRNTIGLTRGDNEMVEMSALTLKDLHILIVEDNLVNQKVLSKQLRNLGCNVKVANHGGECIEHMRKTKFWRGHEHDGADLSVVLMDLEMPVMDGLTCTRKIREYQQSGDVVGHVPIIAVSANARNAHIESAIAAGMDDVVSKPFRIPELLPKIEQLMLRHGLAGTIRDHPMTSPTDSPRVASPSGNGAFAAPGASAGRP